MLLWCGFSEWFGILFWFDGLDLQVLQTCPSLLTVLAVILLGLLVLLIMGWVIGTILLFIPVCLHELIRQ